MLAFSGSVESGEETSLVSQAGRLSLCSRCGRCRTRCRCRWRGLEKQPQESDGLGFLCGQSHRAGDGGVTRGSPRGLSGSECHRRPAAVGRDRSPPSVVLLSGWGTKHKLKGFRLMDVIRCL